MKKKLEILFYVEYPYYFPHFIPISNYFQSRGASVIYILSAKQNVQNMENIAKKNNVSYSFDLEYLYKKNIDVVFFANHFEFIAKVSALKIILEHGVGTKFLTTFYKTIKTMDIYLIEGKHRQLKMSREFPKYVDKLKVVGFSKLDAITDYKGNYKEGLYTKYKLDKDKKIILYAPTFFPSSIEKMGNDFPEIFSECNIIVKAHYLTFERSKYKKQVEKFNVWRQYSNVTILPLEEDSIVPFLAISDVMISDESSAMFEFAALNKPVISNRFLNLRWSYYLMPWKLRLRMDSSKDKYRTILDNANSYEEMVSLTKEALINPRKLEQQRIMFSKDICGVIDGRVSERIYNVVINKIEENNEISI